MRQFEVFENPVVESKTFAPFLAVLQSHYLNFIDTTVVAPLVRDSKTPFSEVDVPLTFQGEQLVLAISELSSLSRSNLRKVVGSVAAYEDAIRRALDRLFTGF